MACCAWVGEIRGFSSWALKSLPNVWILKEVFNQPLKWGFQTALNHFVIVSVTDSQVLLFVGFYMREVSFEDCCVSLTSPPGRILLLYKPPPNTSVVRCGKQSLWCKAVRYRCFSKEHQKSEVLSRTPSILAF